MIARTDDKHHAKLQADVDAALKAVGYLTDLAGFHDVLGDEAIRALKPQTNLTALYVRSRADQLAVHRGARVCFLWEVKTNSGGSRNVAIEALPLQNYRSLQIECLYIYRDVVDGFEGGFWASQDLPIGRLDIPQRWWDTPVEARLRTLMPDVPVRRIATTRGSGDPYILIWSDCRRSFMFDWRTHVREIAAGVASQ